MDYLQRSEKYKINERDNKMIKFDFELIRKLKIEEKSLRQSKRNFPKGRKLVKSLKNALQIPVDYLIPRSRRERKK